MAQKSLLRQALIVALISPIGGIAIYLTHSVIGLFLTNALGGMVPEMGLVIQLSLQGFVIGIAVVISVFTTGVLLSLCKIPRAIFITIAATAAIKASYQLPFLFTNGSIYSFIIFTILLYIFVHELFLFLFNGFKTAIYIPLIISIILIGAAFYFLPNTVDRSMRQQEEAKEAQEMKSTDIEYYAPKKPIGRFTLKDISFNYRPPADTSPYPADSWVSFYYTNSTFVNLFKVPDWYDPPKNCGDNEPVKEIFSAYDCLEPITTAKGRIIYPASHNANPIPEQYFTKIDNTLIVFSPTLGETTEVEEVKNIVDSFEPVTFEELKELDKKANEKQR